MIEISFVEVAMELCAMLAVITVPFAIGAAVCDWLQAREGKRSWK